MAILRVLTATAGDEQTWWDNTATGAGDAETQAAVTEAERVFAAAKARGAIAVALRAGQQPTRIERFDATAEQIIMVSPVVGG
jgi:hypothetical protein